MNARKREPLTDFSRIDRRYDLIVTKKNVDLSHQRHKIRNCHWNLFLHFPSYISQFLVTNTIMAHEIEFFQSYLISDLYLIYILNDFKKSNVCCFCYNSFEHLCGFYILVRLGVVSLTLRELSKIFSRNLCIAKIALPMSITSWNFVRVPKASWNLFVCPTPCFGHTDKFSAWNSHHKCDYWHCVFSRYYFGELAKR